MHTNQVAQLILLLNHIFIIDILCLVPYNRDKDKCRRYPSGDLYGK